MKLTYEVNRIKLEATVNGTIEDTERKLDLAFGHDWCRRHTVNPTRYAVCKAQQSGESGRCIYITESLKGINDAFITLNRDQAITRLKVNHRPTNSNEAFSRRVAINALIALAEAD